MHIGTPLTPVGNLVPADLGQGDTVLRPIADSTERRRAGERGERQFQMLADSMPVLVWMARSDGHIFWYNQRWYDYTGTTFEATQGWGWKSVHDTRQLPSVLERWQLCIVTGDAFEMVLQLKGKDGVFRPFLTRVVPIKDDDGNVERWFGTNTDITELKRAAEVEQLMIAVVQSAEDAIMTKTLDGVVRSANPAAELMLGYRAEEIIGESVLRLIPEACRDEEAMILESIMKGRRVAHLETLRRRKDGSLIDVSLTVSPIRDDEGAIVGASKVMRDISERRLAESELKKSHEQLRALNMRLEERVAERTAALAAANLILAQKNEEVEAFVYIVSHDLRAPLVNLQGFASELTRSCTALEETLRTAELEPDIETTVLAIVRDDIAGALRYISASTMKFQGLIDTLLLLSRTGKQELRFERADVQGIVDSTVMSLHQTIDGSGAEVIVDALPVITGDVTAIGQVFSNLISNAVKYLQPGRPGQIVVGGEKLGSVVHYWVRDNGAGIAASAHPRLFQVFQRFHPTLASGEGMGLAIVKRLIERHGGRVWAETEEGVGSTFHMELPTTGGAKEE
jgi:PAS domain S-box-containing protein